MDDNFNECLYFDGCCCTNESRKGDPCITPIECGIFEIVPYPEPVINPDSKFNIKKI